MAKAYKVGGSVLTANILYVGSKLLLKVKAKNE
jgi:hypothetical protein